MNFELVPVIDVMLGLYSKPRSIERFKEYIATLQGNSKDDMELPISGFNPMAKEHVIAKLNELRSLHAENLMRECVSKIEWKGDRNLKVVLSLMDDLKGGWTNRFTSDYKSKFELSGLISRNFVTPVFWSSENYSTALVFERTLEYCYRSIYWLQHPKPRTLRDHLLQEKFVCDHVLRSLQAIDLSGLQKFYDEHKNSEDPVLISCFLYGDAANESLGNKAYGIRQEFAGFTFARYVSNERIDI
jgi:hypothetical protein